nr:zincin-like metallopeptidase domain-containing protein [uncultured Blautia sp.]
MDVYSIVTERIIKQLEQGYIPWRKPWTNCLDGAFNMVSKRPYSLLNQLLLSHEGEYATYKQWEQLGGVVKKGEVSEIVVFWKIQEIVERGKDGKEEIRKIPLLRYYNVFHISQVLNITSNRSKTHYDTQPIERAEKVFRDYIEREQIALCIGDGNRAFYSPMMDSITLPSLTQFERAEEFYCTAFHECGHSTMPSSRCNRVGDNQDACFGNPAYSKEELVAEITSATIMHSLRLETPESFRNSCAYIQNWIQVLKNDKKFIVSVSGRAERAAKYILNME